MRCGVRLPININTREGFRLPTFTALDCLQRLHVYLYWLHAHLHEYTRISQSTRAVRDTNAYRHIANILDWLMLVSHHLKLPDLHLP